MIEQEFTPEEFTAYAFAQVRKAADEDENVSAIRMIALSNSINVAKASFEQSVSATIPVIEAKETDETMSHQKALGSERGGAISNPEDLGKDLTKAPTPDKDSLTKALDNLTKALGTGDTDGKGKDPEPVQKGVGPREATFEDLDNMEWPEDMTVGRVDAEWGDDPK